MLVVRAGYPQPPFWSAAFVSPYTPLRAVPLAIDYRQMTATATGRREVEVCEEPADSLGRERGEVDEPWLVEATGAAEAVFGRGEQLGRSAVESGRLCTTLISTDGAVPALAPAASFRLAISCWPLRLDDLERLFRIAAGRGIEWGALVPVVFPLTTHLDPLDRLADLCARHRARFLTAVAVDLDATARHAVIEMTAAGEEEFDTLFHSDLELISIATERHVAALAAERGLGDAVLLPRDHENRNWNLAVLLARTGDRLLRIGRNSELAWELIRASRAIAELPKEIEVIAETGSVTMVTGVEGVIADIAEEWLSGRPPGFVAEVDQMWRLRRDYGR